MNLEKLNVVDTVEKTTEMRELTVTIAFEFEDGKCVDEGLQGLYDYLAPKADVIEDEVTTDSLDTDWSN